MKTKGVPAVIMLTAGFIDCLLGIYNHLTLMEFTKELLIVLILFYIVGSVVKIVLDINFPKEEETSEETSDEIQNPEEDEEKMENVDVEE